MCHDECTEISCVKVGCCNPTSYYTCSTYECIKDLTVHVSMCTVLLVQIPMYNPIDYCALLCSIGLHVRITKSMIMAT